MIVKKLRVASEILCIQSCLREETCKIVNYLQGGDEKTLCEIFQSQTDTAEAMEACKETSLKHGWMAISIKVRISVASLWYKGNQL